jgi:hypothetical protein
LHQLNIPDYLLSEGPNEPFFANRSRIHAPALAKVSEGTARAGARRPVRAGARLAYVWQPPYSQLPDPLGERSRAAPTTARLFVYPLL